MYLTNYDLQRVLKKAGFYNGKIDGIVGRKTKKAIAELTSKLPSGFRGKAEVAAVQIVMKSAGLKVTIDGFYGPNTESNLEDFLDKKQWRDEIFKAGGRGNPGAKFWPRYKDIEKFYGRPGTGHVRIYFPYEMFLAWDTSTRVRSTLVHGLCAPAYQRIFLKTSQTYNAKELNELGLNMFGGCFNDRTMRGGRKKSTHAYACAMDLDPVRNGLRWKAPRARLSHSDCDDFWNIVKAEGLVSLGQARDFDWMHMQACRF